MIISNSSAPTAHLGVLREASGSPQGFAQKLDSGQGIHAHSVVEPAMTESQVALPLARYPEFIANYYDL